MGEAMSTQFGAPTVGVVYPRYLSFTAMFLSSEFINIHIRVWVTTANLGGNFWCPGGAIGISETIYVR